MYKATETFTVAYQNAGGDKDDARGFLDQVLPDRPREPPSKSLKMMRLSELQSALESLPPPSKALRQDALPAPAPVPAPAPAHAPAPAPALACAP